MNAMDEAVGTGAREDSQRLWRASIVRLKAREWAVCANDGVCGARHGKKERSRSPPGATWSWCARRRISWRVEKYESERTMSDEVGDNRFSTYNTTYASHSSHTKMDITFIHICISQTNCQLRTIFHNTNPVFLHFNAEVFVRSTFSLSNFRAVILHNIVKAACLQ